MIVQRESRMSAERERERERECGRRSLETAAGHPQIILVVRGRGEGRGST